MNPYSESCAFIASNPKWVFIDDEKNDEYAAKLALQDLKIPSWRESVYPESDDKIIDFLGVINSVNFCFPDFKTHKKFDIEYPEGSGKIWSGTFGMAMCFKRALDEGIPVLDPGFLVSLTEKDAKHIFRHKNTAIPMFYERFINLRNIGLVFCHGHYGFDSFTQLFKQNDFKFLNIVSELSRNFYCYYDSRYLDGREILFHKRAQLFPMMYHGRALSSGGKLQPIRDPENFGPISDYVVLKVKRELGILRYHPELAQKVDSGIVIPQNSPMEVEIRAQDVNSSEKALKKINTIRSAAGLGAITNAELDYAYWSSGRAPEYRSIRHHYTLTTGY